MIHVTPATPTLKTDPKGENALDALLEELQTFAKPSSGSKKPGMCVNSYRIENVFIIYTTNVMLLLYTSNSASAPIIFSNQRTSPTVDVVV